MSYQHDLLTGENTFMESWSEALNQARKNGTLYENLSNPEMSAAEYRDAATKHSDDYIHKWYFETRALRKAEDEEHEHAHNTVKPEDSASVGLEAALNKPLPPLPRAPYFEYLFANAGVETKDRVKYSPDNLSLNDDNGSQAMDISDPSSPGDIDPITPPASPEHVTVLDHSAFAQYAFSQAGVHVTTKELIDNHLATMSTALGGGYLEIDEANEVDKDDATMGFYGDIKVEQSPSPYHAPIIDQDSGFGDIREGSEQFPEQWSFKEKKQNFVSAAATTNIRSNGAHVRVSPVTKPRRRKPKPLELCKVQTKKRAARDSFDIVSPNSTSDSSTHEHSIKKARIDQGKVTVVVDASGSSPLIVSPLSPIYTVITPSNRSPLASPVSPWYTTVDADFQSSPLSPLYTNNAGNPEYPLASPTSPIYTTLDISTDLLPSPTSPIYNDVADTMESAFASPVSVVQTTIVDARFPEPLVASPISPDYTKNGPSYSPFTPTASVITDLDSDDNDSDIIDEHDTIATATVAALEAEYTSESKSIRGYPGQFYAYNVADVMYSASGTHKPLPTGHTFGDRLHPNFLLTNISFIACPLFPSLDIPRRYSTDYGSRVHRALKHCDLMSSFSLMPRLANLRTKSQSDLRREVHLECASARLEGVSVGQYRYYQGHLNVEEYKEREMCVCWDECVCAKFCTLYGDLKCPCSGMVVVHKD